MAKKKIKIGIELNHVVRDINKQIAKYYQKDYDNSIDLDDIDYKDDVIKTICKFDSSMDKIKFMYEDYPYEIFGCANTTEKGLMTKINTFQASLQNQEEYDVELFYYSLREFDIAIPSTMFFLSKIGSRFRNVLFPKSIKELENKADVLITADNEVVKHLTGKCKIILIKTNFNIKSIYHSDIVYDKLSDFINDENKFVKICERQENKKKSLLTFMRSWITFLKKMVNHNAM